MLWRLWDRGGGGSGVGDGGGDRDGSGVGNGEGGGVGVGSEALPHSQLGVQTGRAAVEIRVIVPQETGSRSPS